MNSQRNTVRFGIVGLGNRGLGYVNAFNGLRGGTLTAACDASNARLDALPPDVARFTDCDAMLDSGLIDAVIVAVPHFAHAPVSAAALQRGLHVLCEKPLAVSISEARKLVAIADARPHLAFGIVLQLRMHPMNAQLQKLIADGEIGDITRITWIATDWFRSNAYYQSAGWRATWRGEGGGMLINQCPHNFDLLQWITGLIPSRITAVGFIGKTHPIEVEDEVSATLEYESGAIGHFIATTGEAPGTNRLEIVGDLGKVIVENKVISLHKNADSVRRINATSPDAIPTIEVKVREIAYDRTRPWYEPVLIQNFVDHITMGVPLISPGAEGLKGLEIGNAMTIAAITRQPIDLPLDGRQFDTFLQTMQNQSDKLKRDSHISHTPAVGK